MRRGGLRHAAGFAPRLIGQDEASGTLAMEYLPPENHPLWKNQLRDGIADDAFAARVAEALVTIHARSAADPAVAAEFPTDGIFYDIRWNRFGSDSKGRIRIARIDCWRWVATTQANKKALVHATSVRRTFYAVRRGRCFWTPNAPWWGDPAFDLAFCLNHLAVEMPLDTARAGRISALFRRAGMAYARGVTWEPAEALEQRAAWLLPGLFLARVGWQISGEYITDEGSKDRVRRVARALLADPPDRLADIRGACKRNLTHDRNQHRLRARAPGVGQSPAGPPWRPT